MPRYQLARDVQMIFQGLHTVRAKAGTPLRMVMCGTGPGYVIPVARVETDSATGRGTIWAHDTTFYHIWAPADAVEEVLS
ncbi:hypothetical protein DK26_14915 [Bosea sp. WAO]|uniref:hypothetical protein n=1 Tax=Bosea sp. WAO TaxID=406341 RepID=UPI000747BBB8|nr:hypothetical protein [Bosea sp. WAO]KUL94306.1 hypothetical protein DK26_14915 [Bosea sp. WAO]